MKFVNIVIGRILYILLLMLIIVCRVFKYLFVWMVAIPYLIYIRWFCPCPRCGKRGEMEHTNHIKVEVNFQGVDLSDHWAYFLCHHCGAKLKWYRDAWEDVGEKEWNQYGVSRKEAQSVRLDFPLVSDASPEKKVPKKSAKQKRKRK